MASSVGDHPQTRHRFADITSHIPICIKLSLHRLASYSRQFVWNRVTGTKVHFIWRLPSMRRMRNVPVVLIDIKLDQPTKSAIGVQLVDKQPLMFEISPHPSWYVSVIFWVVCSM